MAVPLEEEKAGICWRCTYAQKHGHACQPLLAHLLITHSLIGPLNSVCLSPCLLISYLISPLLSSHLIIYIYIKRKQEERKGKQGTRHGEKAFVPYTGWKNASLQAAAPIGGTGMVKMKRGRHETPCTWQHIALRLKATELPFTLCREKVKNKNFLLFGPVACYTYLACALLGRQREARCAGKRRNKTAALSRQQAKHGTLAGRTKQKAYNGFSLSFRQGSHLHRVGSEAGGRKFPYL